MDEDKIKLLKESEKTINRIAFKEDGTLSVLETNENNPSQQIELLKAFGIPHKGLTENNLNWFRYEEGDVEFYYK